MKLIGECESQPLPRTTQKGEMIMTDPTKDNPNNGSALVQLILAALLVGAAAGGSVLTADQFRDAYVCTATDKPRFCTGTATHPEPLSPSGQSCYFTNEAGKDTYSRCTGTDASGAAGYYQPLKDYAIANGIDPQAFMHNAMNQPEPEPETEPPQNTQKPGAMQELCIPGHLTCVPKTSAGA